MIVHAVVRCKIRLFHRRLLMLLYTDFPQELNTAAENKMTVVF